MNTIFVKSFFLAVFLIFQMLLPSGRAAADQPSTSTLRVQLLWKHQAQFAGLYVAQARKYFEAQGIQIEIISGGPNINPITEIQEGRADIALSWLDNAWEHSKRSKEVTNIAQIFNGSSLSIICRADAGIYTAKDLQDKEIGVWNLGDEHVVAEVVRRVGVPRNAVKLVPQQSDGADLINKVLPCVTAMGYNEYWKILKSGISATDLTIITPEQFGIPHIEDGLYVLSARLGQADFQRQLVHFLYALKKGWADARQAPTLALETVQRLDSSVDQEHQRHMLETVLTLLPNDNKFGLLDLKRYEDAVQTMIGHGEQTPEPPAIWTHRIWNSLHSDPELASGSPDSLKWKLRSQTTSTVHYVKTVFGSEIFGFVVLMGTLAFAVSATILAIDMGYGLWGRLIVAMASSMGGGAIRDTLIGNERLPFYFMSQWEYPVGIFFVVLAASLLIRRGGTSADILVSARVRYWSELIGFSIIAVNGAYVAVIAQLPWYWVPFCAALSCTGGGLLQDIMMNREPSTFRGLLFEEIAITTGIAVLIGLQIANLYEQSPTPVYITTTCGFLLAAALLHWVTVKKPKFPEWMGYSRPPTSP